jgi:predicted DNA-binding protein
MDDEEQLTEIVSFRVTRSELSRLNALAARDQRTRADWLRIQTRSSIERLSAEARVRPSASGQRGAEHH